VCGVCERDVLVLEDFLDLLRLFEHLQVSFWLTPTTPRQLAADLG